MSVFIKICGLCSLSDVQAVAELKPDAIGFVFWKGSQRCVLADEVAQWIEHVPPAVRKVGVFVDSPVPEILRIAETAHLDVLQLHGFQSLEKEPEFFPMFGKGKPGFSAVWKVVHLGRDSGAPAADSIVDAYLLDSFNAESPGGTGVKCDWTVAARFVQGSRKPVLLAGGLNPKNVAEAIRQVNPWGVDVSSGVEGAPGKKDIRKVKDFIDQCRSVGVTDSNPSD